MMAFGLLLRSEKTRCDLPGENVRLGIYNLSSVNRVDDLLGRVHKHGCRRGSGVYCGIHHLEPWVSVALLALHDLLANVSDQNTLSETANVDEEASEEEDNVKEDIANLPLAVVHEARGKDQKQDEGSNFSKVDAANNNRGLEFTGRIKKSAKVK
jgi:hypothetical protein